MKLLVIRFIATILFSFAVLKYMSQNSSAYKHFTNKEIKFNQVTPNIDQS